MKSDNQKKYVQNWTSASKIGTDTKESTFITALDSSHDTIDAGVEFENSESKSKVETSMNQQKSKHVTIERTVTKHETMEVVSSSSVQVHQVSEKLQKVAKSSSEKHETVTEISSNKKVTNTTSKSEQQHHVSKTRSEIPSDSTIEEQIDNFVKSTTEEEAKALLEQISASHSAFIFHFVN